MPTAYEQFANTHDMNNPAAVAQWNQQSGGSTPPPSTLQQFSIGLANGTIQNQQDVNNLYGNPSYGSAVPDANPITTRNTGAPMAPAGPLTAQQMDAQSGQNNPYGYSSAGARIANPNPVNSALAQNDISGAGGGGWVPRTGGMSPEEEELTRFIETPEKPKTEAQIAQEKTAGAQDLVNSINQNYNNQLLDQSRANDQRSAETNAQSVLNGLSGSSEAGRYAGETTARNNQDNKKIQDQRTLALSTLYNSIRNDAATEARQQAQDYRTNAKDALSSMATRREANVAKAEKSVISLASSGATIEGLKSTDPATYKYLADSVGGEAQLKAMFILNRPQESIIDKRVENGKYIIVTQNPLTGKTSIETVDLGIPPEFDGSADLGDRMMFYPKSDPSKAIFIAKAPDQLKQLQIQKAQQDLQKGNLEIKAEIEKQAGALSVTPEVLQTRMSTVNLVTQILDDPDFANSVGLKSPGAMFGGALGGTYGSSVGSVIAKEDQLKAILALENRAKLKGSGAVSDFESKTLDKSGSAFSRNLSNEQAKQSLIDVRGALMTMSGQQAMVKITSPKGESKVAPADTQTITDAITAGYKVEYQ